MLAGIMTYVLYERIQKISSPREHGTNLCIRIRTSFSLSLSYISFLPLELFRRRTARYAEITPVARPPPPPRPVNPGARLLISCKIVKPRIHIHAA